MPVLEMTGLDLAGKRVLIRQDLDAFDWSWVTTNRDSFVCKRLGPPFINAFFYLLYLFVVNGARSNLAACHHWQMITAKCLREDILSSGF